MNYKKIYDSLVEKCKTQVLPTGTYTEKHHIIPRSLGGLDSPDNIVTATARQHFMLHALLYYNAKRTGTVKEKQSMAHAWNLMRSSPTKENQRYFNSRIFEAQKADFSARMSKLQSGKNNSQYGTRWVTNGELNKRLKPGEDTPEGYWPGRCMTKKDPDVPYQHEKAYCVDCGDEFFRKTNKTKSQRKRRCNPCAEKTQMPLLFRHKKEFIELMDNGFSANESCKEIGRRCNTAMQNYGMSGKQVEYVRTILSESNRLHLLNK